MMDYDFIVGFTLFNKSGFKTRYRHFNDLDTVKLFVSNVNLKDNSKIYVDLELYNEMKGVIKRHYISKDKLKEIFEEYSELGAYNKIKEILEE